VDGEALKPEHKAFLANRVAPLLKDDRCHIWIVGSTSLSGTSAHDMALSQKRARNVASALRDLHVLDRQMQFEAVGKERSKGHKLEEKMDRAVTIVVYPMPKKRSYSRTERPSLNIPDPPKVSTKFKLQMLSGDSGELVLISAEDLIFRILDTTNNLIATYEYKGVNLGPSALPYAHTFKGGWTDFRTNAPVRVSQFDGFTRFTSAGGAKWSLNYISFVGLPRGVHTEPRPVAFSTGCSTNLSASTGVGKLTLVDGERPFAGN
jgi:hypothetical protein